MEQKIKTKLKKTEEQKLTDRIRYFKEYYINNKTVLRERAHLITVCDECQKTVIKKNLTRHKKTNLCKNVKARQLEEKRLEEKRLEKLEEHIEKLEEHINKFYIDEETSESE